MLYYIFLLVLLVSKLLFVGTTFSSRFALPSAHHHPYDDHHVGCATFTNVPVVDHHHPRPIFSRKAQPFPEGWQPPRRRNTLGYRNNNRKRAPWRRDPGPPPPEEDLHFDLDKFLEVLGPGLFPIPLILALIPLSLPALPLILWAEHHYEQHKQQQEHATNGTVTENGDGDFTIINTNRS